MYQIGFEFWFSKNYCVYKRRLIFLKHIYAKAMIQFSEFVIYFVLLSALSIIYLIWYCLLIVVTVGIILLCIDFELTMS